MIPIEACSEEGGPGAEGHIRSEDAMCVGEDLLLRLGIGKRKRIGTTNLLRDIREQVIDGLEAHFGEHQRLESKIGKMVRHVVTSRLSLVIGTASMKVRSWCSARTQD